MTTSGRERRELAAEALVLATLLALYFGIGFAFSPGRLFGRADLVFGADVPRVIADLTRFDANHYRTKVHPLFVVLLNPVGLLLKGAIGFPRVTAIFMNATFGAFSVALFLRLLRRLGVGGRAALLWTALFGLSASQLFFGSIPETYAFSGASLLLLFVLFVEGVAGGARFVAASVFSFGITASNLAVGLVLRAYALEWRAGWRPALRALIRYAAMVVLTAAALSIVQEWYYPRARVFFGPQALQEEASYLFLPGSLGDAARRAGLVAGNVFFFDLAAPKLAVEKAANRYPVTTFLPPGRDAFRLPGLVHAALAAVLFVGGAAALVRRRLYEEPATGSLLSCLGISLALHSTYGETLFLYSCQWTFAVLALAAVAWERVLAEAPRRRHAFAVLLAVLLTLQVRNNAAFLFELYSIYR